jgi:hypothetical protein
VTPEQRESLKRCRCAIGQTDGWCGSGASAEDGLCDMCREGCQRSGDAVVLSVEEVLERDGVSR